MKTLARITGAIFLGLGSLTVLGGLLWLLITLVRGVADNPSPYFMQYQALLRGGRVLLAGAVSLQGLLLAAVGEVLWLLADIAEAGHRPPTQP